MDDIDLNLCFGQQIAAIARLLHAIADDPTISASNAGFLVCDLDGATTSVPCLAEAAVAFVDGVGSGDGSPPAGISSDGEALPRFVQFCVERAAITLDQPTTTLAIAEGERLLRERDGFRMERDLVPGPGSGSVFSESLVKVFSGVAIPDLSQRCRAAATDAVWIIHELWGLDPQVPIQVSAFTHDGRGRLPRLDGPLRRFG